MTRSVLRALSVPLGVALLLTACSGDDDAAPTASTAPTGPDRPGEALNLTSPLFEDGGALPVTVTCDGAGELPPLRWVGVPEGAAELALVVTDPDAPDGGFLHLAAFGLDPGRAEVTGELPAGARQTANSAGQRGWTPPCPPKGDDPHRYQFELLVLDEPTGIEDGASADEVEDTYRDKVIASARLTGTYERAR